MQLMFNYFKIMNKVKFSNFIILLTSLNLIACSQNYNNTKNMNYNRLTSDEEKIIVYKGTENPFTGAYYNHFEKGIYLCKRCGSELYISDDKFESHCGWPSFDDEIKGAIKKVPDKDGSRTEILCNNCGAHLGHIFFGERFTDKNTRHCVNSISLQFLPFDYQSRFDTAIVAGGCFWGVEYFYKKENGVISTEVGYTGGFADKPSYQDVCKNFTGHAEAVKIIFDCNTTDYEKILKLFFEIHDFNQYNRQGPDIGEQYRSEIFYKTVKQKRIAEKLIQILKDKGLNVVTKLTYADKFWKAEEYHQDYYEKKGNIPYCHFYKKIF